MSTNQTLLCSSNQPCKCEKDATATVKIIDESGFFSPMYRDACDRHIGRYKREFEDRGYEVETVELGTRED